MTKVLNRISKDSLSSPVHPKMIMKRSVVLILFLLLSVYSVGQTLAGYVDKGLGVVSFTYRNSFSKDVGATLDTIKSVGLTNLEISNLFGISAKQFRALLDERNMRCTSFGVSYDDLQNKLQDVAANAKELGASYVRVAWIPAASGKFNEADAKRAAELFNRAGKILREEHNLTFCYHNHGYEFAPYENGTLFDYFAGLTDPRHVSFEMDIFWVAFPGADPVAFLKKYGKRIRLMHIKDMKRGLKGDFSGGTDQNNNVAIGSGQLDIPAILKEAKRQGVKYFYIEDESSRVNVQVPESLRFLKGLK